MTPVDPPLPVVIVADAHADMREYVASCFRIRAQVQVHEAADGLEALHLARALRPALLIIERVLPRLSSETLCRSLRTDARTRDIPVLVLSDHPHPTTAIGDGCLLQPFNARQLQREAERLIGCSLKPG